MKTLLLDVVQWDICRTADNNIAIASDPYSMAQDAASVLRCFQGECYYDQTVGVPYYQQIFGQSPPISLMKTKWNAAAATVPGVTAAQSFLISWIDRRPYGQVQITSKSGGFAATGF